MDLTKKILLSLLFVFFLPSVLIADVLDDELPGDTPVQVKEKARQAIHLGVDSEGVVKMTQTMLQNRFTEQQMIKACEILGEAKRNGLSEEPLMSKLYEGVGKHAQNENIIMAMEKVRDRYQVASQYAKQMSSDRRQSEILTGNIAESLSAGMTENHIARITRMFNNLQTQNNGEKSSLEIQTFMTVKTMARVGASSASVADAVESALRNGYNVNNMRRLEKAFVVQARARYNPTSIAETFSRGIGTGVSVDDMGRKGYMNSGSMMGANSYGNGVPGSGMGMGGAGQGGAGGSAGGAGSGGMGGMGSSGGMGGSGSGQGSGGSGGGGRGGR